MNTGSSCRALALLATLLFQAVLPNASLAQQTSDESEAQRLVDEALERELQGDNAGRQRLLGEAKRRFPDFAPARWQAGEVQQEGNWLDLDSARRAASERPTLIEYYRRRDEAATTVASQLQLARWCKRNSLDAQRRAHLTSVLTIDPGHAVARRELGYLRINGEWIRKDDQAQRDKEIAARRDAFAHWQPIAVEIRTGLKSSDESNRKKALARLQAIGDEAATDALEWTFAADDMHIAGPVLEVLSKMPGQITSVSLGRFAAFSPSNDVRLTAVEHLAARPENESVPPLLDLLSTQIEGRIDYMVSPTGRFYVRHLLFREGSNTKYLFASDFDYYPVKKLERVAQREVGNNFAARFNHFLAHAKMDRDISAEQEAVASANESIAEINARVIWVLERLMKVDLGDDPYAWWQGWYGNYSTPSADKKVVAAFHRKHESVNLPSCELIDGVRIHTERGEIPIELVRVGDRALSQNPDTGEVAFQPVLFVSNTGDAREVVTLRIEGNEVDATPTQRFWVVGRGWIAAADLKPGDRIHGLHGSSRVESIAAGKTAKTTHIVIEGVQNAFLGKQALLGGDHSGRETNGRALPGMKAKP